MRPAGPATNGSATKAAQDSAVNATHEHAETADQSGDPVGGDPHRGIGDGEDRLIQHQDQDHDADGAIPTSAANFGR